MHLKKDCISCIYNLYGLYPCQHADKKEVDEWLKSDTKDTCPDWYDEC